MDTRFPIVGVGASAGGVEALEYLFKAMPPAALGEIDWVGVQRHAGENLAHEALEFLAIVPKAGGTARK